MKTFFVASHLLDRQTHSTGFHLSLDSTRDRSPPLYDQLVWDPADNRCSDLVSMDVWCSRTRARHSSAFWWRWSSGSVACTWLDSLRPRDLFWSRSRSYRSPNRNHQIRLSHYRNAMRRIANLRSVIEHWQSADDSVRPMYVCPESDDVQHSLCLQV